MRSCHQVALVVLLVIVLAAGCTAVLAVPANEEAIRTLVQPDGSSFEGRLAGDEWAHWYETADGYTVVRNQEGYWTYAVQGPDGRLEPSEEIVGRGASPSLQGLKPGAAILGEIADRKHEASRPVSSLQDITGTQNVVIILVEFADTPAGEGSTGPHTPSYFSDASTGIVFGTNQGRMADYFDEVSYGQLTVMGVVADSRWHTSAQNEIYYGGDCDPGACPPRTSDNCNVCIYELAREAIQLADSAFDFAPYDTDSDGVVDHVMIIHAGANQAAFGGADDDIWSHRWEIPGGEPVDGKTVESYMMLSEWDAMSVFAHEFSHDLGAPSLYDYDGDSDPVGRWCNMGYNFESDRPPHLCGLLKIDIDADFSNGMTGWVTPESLNVDSTYMVYRLDGYGTGAVFISDPAFSGSEHFLVENRQRDGYYDYSVPEAGIIITHVDMDMPDGSGAFNDGTPNNSYHGAWIERPSDVASPDGAAYSADDGEQFLTPTTIPNTNANGGVGTGLKFQNIGLEGDSMAVDYRTGPTDVGGPTSGKTVWTLDGSPYRITSNFTVSDGDSLVIEPGVVVKFNYDTRMYVYGTLVAEGTVTDTIAFTSYRDDDWGGDTNGDGPSSGVRADWYDIYFNDPDAPCPMAYCIVRYAGKQYGGYPYDWHAIRLNGAGRSLAMTNCVIEETGANIGSTAFRSFAIYGQSETALEISDCEIRNNGGDGIVSEGSLSIVNSDIRDNGRNAVYCSGTCTMSNSQIYDNGGYSVNCPGRLTMLNSRATGSGSYGVYANGDSSLVSECYISGSGGYGLQLEGLACAVVTDTVVSNAGNGIRILNVPTEFSGNISTGNTEFGYIVPATVVDQVWLVNDPGLNGRENAIGVNAGTVGTSTQWVDEYPYHVIGTVTIGNAVTFTLEPGCVMKFNSGTRLTVNGTLVANGTQADSIAFTSYRDDDWGGDTNGDGPSSGVRGDWYDVYFSDADAGCAMTYCIVRYAGQQYGGYPYNWHSVDLLGTGSSLTITNCVIEQTAGNIVNSAYRCYAIFGQAGTTLEISGCEIRNNSGDGVAGGGALSIVNTVVRDNGRIGIRGGGAISVTGSEILDNGSDGLYLSGADAVVIDNRVTGNGGSGLYMTGSTPQVVADTCLGNYNGLNFGDGVLPAAFTDNYCSGNTYCQYVVPVRDVDAVWLNNECQLGGNIGIRPGSLGASSEWLDDYLYIVFGDITVPHDMSLTLEPGVLMKFTADDNMTVNGQLIASGILGDEIVFTSHKDDEYGGDTNLDGVSTGVPGDWSYIMFDNTNPGCTMQHCIVRYAGQGHGTSNYYRNAVILNGAGAELTMTDCEIERTGAGGQYNNAVVVYAGSDFQMSNCHVHDNNGTGVRVSEPTAQIIGCLAEGNSEYGFYVHPEIAGEIAADDSASGNGYGNCLAVSGGNITVDDTWPRTYTYLVHNNIIIDPGATVVVEKGSVVKFKLGDYKLEVQGGLVGQGDAVDKVVFTSYKDDAYGGDTNVDGMNTVPAPGDWSQVRFNGAHSASALGWAVVSYAGYGNAAALKVDACSLSFSQCIVHDNLDRGVQVAADAEFSFTNSDIYDNGYGLENLNTLEWVDARNCWWGDPSGPGVVGPGTGDNVSDYVLYDPWLDRSIDNPWIAFTSPTTSGDYTDVIIFDLDSDPLLDLIASTEADGIKVYMRTDFETWVGATSPITTGHYIGLDKGNLDNDLNGYDDLLVCGNDGIRCFTGDGAGTLSEVSAPLIGPICTDAKFAYVNHDAYLDIIACSGNNAGIWVFYGDGAGNWTSGNRPAVTGTYNHIVGADLDNDTWIDILAASAEYHGVQVWMGAADSTWSAGTPIDDGHAFFGLDYGDIDKDGDYDVAVGSDGNGVEIYLNDGAGGWDPSPGPTSVGIYNDVILHDLNGDTRLDLAAASQGGGIHVWVGTSTLFWNFWYHPATVKTYKGIWVEDFTLNGTPDLAGASVFHGISLWDNLTPGAYQEYFATTPDKIEFGEVAIGRCAYENFQLENVSADTLWNVVVYTTNPVFTVSPVGGGAGPFDMEPGEIRSFEVEYCPTDEVAENEVVIIHCTQSVTHIRVTGEGVTYIAPIWAVDIEVENAIGDSANSLTLTFGGGIGATDSLDVEAGEVCMPPWPPSEIFDARFDVLGCDDGALVNIHDYYRETDSFRFTWQEGAGGYPVTVSWDPNSLPDGTFLISDEVGGAFLDTLNMADTSQVVLGAAIPGGLVITTARYSTFEYDLDEGWHMLSLAVTADEDTLPFLFPGAVSAFTWATGSGYVQVHELDVGTGYWVDMGVDTVVTHSGQRVEVVDRLLPAGWSMVGALFDTLQVADIAEDPPDCIISVFGFTWHYYEASELLPGQGYWFNVSEECQVTLSQPYGGGSLPPVIASDDENTGGPVPITEADPGCWRLPVTVENANGGIGGLSTVIFGFDPDASSAIDLHLGEREVPPWPPSAVLDGRFAIEGANGLYLDLRSSDAEQEFELVWQPGSGGYPITLSWDPGGLPEGLGLTLRDNIDGSFLGPVDMTSESSITVGEEHAFVTGVVIVASATAAGVSDGDVAITEFDLKRNVPNPFGPMTTIVFDVPRQAEVEIVIYDALGREVRELQRGVVPAGRHISTWDGRDRHGNDVGPGLYFCRMKAGRFTKTQKMSLVR